MTKEQARLLRDVLNDSATSWNTNVTFPATIEQMIDAKIEFYSPMADVERNYKEVYEIYQEKIAELQELKSIIEGK